MADTEIFRPEMRQEQEVEWLLNALSALANSIVCEWGGESQCAEKPLSAASEVNQTTDLILRRLQAEGTQPTLACLERKKLCAMIQIMLKRQWTNAKKFSKPD